MADGTDLTPALREQLLIYLGDRLRTGEVLITAEQFASAVEAGYLSLAGQQADEAMRHQLTQFLAAANAEDPAQLLAPGVENWVALSVFAQVRKAGWGITEVQEQGNQLIRDFLRTERARALLEQLGLKPQLVNMSNCFRFIVNRIAGRQDDSQKDASQRLAGLAAAAAERLAAAARLAREKLVVSSEDLSIGAEERIEALLAAPVDPPDATEIAARKESENTLRAGLRQAQMGELLTNLDNYIALGRITAEDAERLRKAHQVDEAIRSGKVDKEKGSKIRNSILS
ncbi:MAG: hypothetical protein O2782_11525, partial [bacterium]|nr:hypothetical protein [bacterium]